MAELVSSVEVDDSNLYVNGEIITFTKDEEQILRRKLLNYKPTEADDWHTVCAFDRLDLLAWKKWKDIVPNAARYWWVIADANNIFDPFKLDSLLGTDIVIPDILRIRLELL